MLERRCFVEKKIALFPGKRNSRIGLLIDHRELALEIKPQAAGDAGRALEYYLPIRPQTTI